MLFIKCIHEQGCVVGHRTEVRMKRVAEEEREGSVERRGIYRSSTIMITQRYFVQTSIAQIDIG